jgi:hypothetical protein
VFRLQLSDAGVEGLDLRQQIGISTAAMARRTRPSAPRAIINTPVAI